MITCHKKYSEENVGQLVGFSSLAPTLPSCSFTSLKIIDCIHNRTRATLIVICFFLNEFQGA